MAQSATECRFIPNMKPEHRMKSTFTKGSNPTWPVLNGKAQVSRQIPKTECAYPYNNARFTTEARSTQSRNPKSKGSVQCKAAKPQRRRIQGIRTPSFRSPYPYVFAPSRLCIKIRKSPCPVFAPRYSPLRVFLCAISASVVKCSCCCLIVRRIDPAAKEDNPAGWGDLLPWPFPSSSAGGSSNIPTLRSAR